MKFKLTSTFPWFPPECYVCYCENHAMVNGLHFPVFWPLQIEKHEHVNILRNASNVCSLSCSITRVSTGENVHQTENTVKSWKRVWKGFHGLKNEKFSLWKRSWLLHNSPVVNSPPRCPFLWTRMAAKKRMIKACSLHLVNLDWGIFHFCAEIFSTKPRQPRVAIFFRRVRSLFGN